MVTNITYFVEYFDEFKAKQNGIKHTSRSSYNNTVLSYLYKYGA